MKTETVDTNIFRSNSQFLHDVQPENIRPVSDRILVRDTKEPDRIGSIWIPQTAAELGVGKEGLLRMGIVVAVGPGDPYSKEWVERDNLTGQHQVMRRALGICPTCQGCGWVWGDGIYHVQDVCPSCRTIPAGDHGSACGDGIHRWPMQCKVGDTIIYERRKEAEIFINGERFGLIYELQAVLAILEGV